MKLIENIDIPLSLNKGKKEIMFSSTEELLEYYKPCKEMIKALKKSEEIGIIGFIKSQSFTEDDQDFIQLYKKDAKLDEYSVIFEEIRLYRGFVLPFINEGDIRTKMSKIDKGDIDGFYKLKDLI